MITNIETLQIKLIDFGLSGKLKNKAKDHFDEVCGTLPYMAPELIQNHVYTYSVDIWSAAMMMYELLSGKHALFR